MSNWIDKIFPLILEAKRTISKYIKRTPLDLSATFSRMTNAKIYLKLENLQKTGSFKVRGALFKISNLTEEEKKRGVIAASAGNHAQGVAYAASMLGIKSVIVMPIFAPLAKIEATKNYGAEVILYGETFDEALNKALEIAKERGLTFIHPYDDPYIIAGQGTIGLEILEDLRDIDIAVIPIGGGGLISGISIALKKALGDKVKIIGVQTEAFPSYYYLKRGIAPLKLQRKITIADGIAVKSVGKITKEIIDKIVDDIVLVNDDEISRAIYLLLERSKILAEGAGAAALAAILSGKINVEGKNVVVLVSGGNMDMSLLAKIIVRELVKDKKLVRIAGVIPDRPGSLSKLLAVLAKAKVNIVDIYHNRYSSSIPPGFAEVDIIAEVHDVNLLKEYLTILEKENYPVRLVNGW